MVQKFYAIKTGPAIKQGAIISTIFAFVVAVDPISCGFGRLYEARSSTPPTARPSTTPSSRRCVSTLPDVLIGLVIVLRAVGLHVDALVARAHVVIYLTI